MNYEKRLRRNILLSRFQQFLVSLLFFMPIWYAFETQFAPPATLAIIYAITYLVSVFLELPTGALADILGRKLVVCIGLIIQGSSWIILSQTQNITWLWVGYTISQIGGTFVSGANTALLYDSLKELKREQTFNVFVSQNELVYRFGITISTFAGGYIFLINYRLPYILVGIATICAGFITFFMIEPHIDSVKFTLKNYLEQTKLGFQELWKTSYIRDFSLFYISIGGITWYYLYFLLNAYMTDTGFTPVERGWLSAINSILVALVSIIVTTNKLLNRTRVYIFFPLVMLIGFLPAPFLPKFITAINIFLIYLAGIARFTFLDQYTNQEFDSKYRATAISALNMAISFVYVILSFIMGPILSHLGSSWVMFTLGILTLVTTVPSMTVLLRNHTK